MGGVDLQDCSLRCLVAPSRRRYLGLRHPMSGILGVDLFLPLGLGPPPGWNDTCVKAVLGPARAELPQLHVVDFAGDVRFAGVSGEHDALAVGMSGFTSLLEQMGARYRAKDGKRGRQTLACPWPRFVVGAQDNAARMEERKVAKGLRISEALIGCQPGSTAPAQESLASVSFLNFFRWVAPGGFSHLRSGWDSVNESGATDRWRSGTKGPPTRAAVAEELRNGMVWRDRMIVSRPVKKLQLRELGGFAWRPRSPNLRDLALSMGGGFAATIYPDLSSTRGWNATTGDRSSQGKWFSLGRQGTIWKTAGAPKGIARR